MTERGSPPAGVTRRELLAAGAAALLARAAGGEQPGESEGLRVGEVVIPTGRGGIPAYRAGPGGSADLPVVLVIHPEPGPGEHVRRVCRRLAREGLLAVAPDLLRGSGPAAGVADERALADLDAALAFAREAGATGRAAATGFGWGGRITWLYAARRADLAAAVAWYGPLRGVAGPATPRHPIDVAERLQAPVLGLYGSADDRVPSADIYAMRAALRIAQSPSEIVIFPGAPHGFDAADAQSYRELSAREGWRRMLEWLRRHGVAGSAQASGS